MRKDFLEETLAKFDSHTHIEICIKAAKHEDPHNICAMHLAEVEDFYDDKVVLVMHTDAYDRELDAKKNLENNGTNGLDA